MTVTSNGRPIALLTTVDGSTLELEAEIEARRLARALLALERLQKDSIERGTHRLAEAEIESEITAARG